MRIKRLDICGFKSFMDRSVFSFHEGITGVVGPNGCGKSNVVDAIRWVMGEQSAKNLRGRGMEDVIFNGSETQAPLSMSEVTMTLSVEEGDILPPTLAGLPEVSVTRRLFRNGDSEYELNRTRCRLLDITELFLGTGVGTRAYSIIEQGRVGQIVSSRPEDRRTFIEEAAGITRYKARKKAAERKIEHAQNNLLRVNDVVAELKSRNDGLERQAKKAEKYKKLKGEMRRIELHQAAHRHLELLANRRVVEARLQKLNGEEREAFEAVQSRERAISERRDGLELEQLELETLSADVHALSSQVKLDTQNLEHWRADEAGTRARIEGIEAEVVELGQGAEAATAEQAAAQWSSESLSVAGKEDEVALSVMAEELRRTATLTTEIGSRLAKDRGELVDAAGRVANLDSGVVALDQRKGDAEARRAQLHGELDGVLGEQAVVEKGRAEVRERLGVSQKTAQELAERRGVEESSLEQAREAFAENEIQVICQREELADKRSRLHSLEEIQRNYEGYDRGVRAVMQHAGDSPEALGVVGLLSDLLAAPTSLEKPLEAVLAERLQHVVVQSPSKAWEWIERLSSRAEGRATFVPLGPELKAAAERVAVEAPAAEATPDVAVPAVVEAGGAVAELAGEAAAVETPDAPVAAPALETSSASFEAGSAAAIDATFAQHTLPVAALDIVRPTRPEAKALLDVLLDGVYFVTDLVSARAEALAAPHHTFVTLVGEVIRPGGVATGGVLEGPAVGALHKRREIEALKLEVASIEERYNEIVTRHYALQKQMGHSEGVLKGLSRHQHAEELSLAAHEKDLHAAAASLSKLTERTDALHRELEQIDQVRAAIAAETETARGELLHGQADRAARDERVRLLTSEIENLQARAAQQSEEQTALKVKVASIAERVEGAQRASENAFARLEDLKARIERALASKAEALEHIAALTERIATTAAGSEERAARCVEQEAALKTRREAHTQAAQAVRDEETALKALREQLDALTQGLSTLSIQERESAIELEHLGGQIQERWSIPIGHAVGEFHLEKSLTPDDIAHLKDLRGQVERMGEVNVTAIDELKELSERYQFLTKQKLDLESSIDQLHEAIKKIDVTSRERFQQTFEAINERFTKIFPRLFGGGRAGLVLTEEAPGMEAGVEIVAQPPGKKLQSVQLLSGGEKALTAVGMIFSIFLIKPTPFCLLDEVDAPLDEANVGRYNDMVREMSKQSQFILITHNKRTMEIVDNLYGVTMEEPGISKLVTVKIREAVAANENQVA